MEKSPRKKKQNVRLRVSSQREDYYQCNKLFGSLQLCSFDSSLLTPNAQFGLIRAERLIFRTITHFLIVFVWMCVLCLACQRQVMSPKFSCFNAQNFPELNSRRIITVSLLVKITKWFKMNTNNNKQRELRKVSQFKNQTIQIKVFVLYYSFLTLITSHTHIIHSFTHLGVIYSHQSA